MKVNFEFEYEIGEVLNLKCLPDAVRVDSLAGPVRYIVVALRTETCVAGTQGFYACRMVDPQGNSGKDVVLMSPFEVKVWKVRDEA